MSPVASAVATRATQMVELLSRDNVALREKLESVYHKMNNMQMVRVLSRTEETPKLCLFCLCASYEHACLSIKGVEQKQKQNARLLPDA